jgi:hypothetical protein
MQIATLILSGASLVVSTTTLVLLVKGGTQMKKDVDAAMADVKKKTNKALFNLKAALDNLEF